MTEGRGAAATTRRKVLVMDIDKERFEKGLRIFRVGLVEQTGEFTFKVRSESNSCISYTVNKEGCTCADNQMRQIVCKHMIACGIYFACSMWIPIADESKPDPARGATNFSVELPVITGLTISIHRGRATISFGN